MPTDSTVSESTTISTSTLSTTTKAPFNATAFCSGLTNGYHPHPESADCTQYVLCLSNGLSMIGTIYTCMPSAFFNPTLLFCQIGYICVPPTTTTTVSSTVPSTTTM